MKLYKLLENIEYNFNGNLNLDTEIESVASRIEQISSNSLFILVESINFSVKNILDYIREKSPSVMITEKRLIDGSFDFPVITVENARAAMARVYSSFYAIDYSRLKFIGITGTNGKTSTATMLFEILKKSGRKAGFIGTGKIKIENSVLSNAFYSMTTPDPEILYKSIKEMEKAECEFIVMEVSSHALYFDKLAPIAFELAVFTNLSEEHLDFHKSIDEYFKSKEKLFSMTKNAVINFDDKHGRILYESLSIPKSGVGIIWCRDAYARDIVNKGFDGMEYIYREKKRAIKICLKPAGAYNIYNSMLAIKSALILGIPLCVAKEALSAIDKIDGRFEIINSDIQVIIDYAHTPYALYSLLLSINSIKSKSQKLTLIFGCGGSRDRLKRPKMGRIAEEYADEVIISSDNSRSENEADIISEIMDGMKFPTRHKVILSRKEAIEYAILNAKSGDIIALVGKGHEQYNIDKNGIHPFSERAIVNDALNLRKKNKL